MKKRERKPDSKAIKDLFTFTWAVDEDGYEIVTPPKPAPSYARRAGLIRPGKTLLGDPAETAPEKRLQRKGGTMRPYVPMEREDLARELARLPLTPDLADEAIVTFANRFGYLGQWNWPNESPDKGSEPLSLWHDAVSGIRAIFFFLENEDRRRAIDIFNRGGIGTQVMIDAPEDGSRKAELKFVPHTLATTAWLQAMEEIMGGRRIATCKNCPRTFRYRKNREFCGDACRMAWHRRQQEASR